MGLIEIFIETFKRTMISTVVNRFLDLYEMQRGGRPLLPPETGNVRLRVSRVLNNLGFDANLVKDVENLIDMRGIINFYKIEVKREPHGWCNNDTTIEVVNLKGITKIIIDGRDVPTTDYSISGSANNLKITLKTPMPRGKRRIIVMGGGKAAYFECIV